MEPSQNNPWFVRKERIRHDGSIMCVCLITELIYGSHKTPKDMTGKKCKNSLHGGISFEHDLTPYEVYLLAVDQYHR